MQPPENQIHYHLPSGVGPINYENIILPRPHSSLLSSSSCYIPVSDVMYDQRDGTLEDRTVAALRNHKEAEKRRRTRINSHLDELRSLLPCNSKMDKATLLAMVVQRLRELKQQTSHITALGTFPSESDEISVVSCEEHLGGSRGLMFKASLCCEDRSDFFPDLIKVLNSLHLKVHKAEMSTLGGRIRNVLFVAANKDHSVESIQFLQNSLKPLLGPVGSAEQPKRRRLLDRKIVI